MTPTAVSMTHILPGGSWSHPPRQERQAEVAERCLFPAVSAGLLMASDNDVHRADGGVVHEGRPGNRPPEYDDTLPPPDLAGGVSSSGAVRNPMRPPSGRGAIDGARTRFATDIVGCIPDRSVVPCSFLHTETYTTDVL